MRKVLLIVIILGILFVAGFIIWNITREERVIVDKENNICRVNSDCEYIIYTGGCNTPEYVNKIMSACQNGIGLCPSEAFEREGVICTCENNKCVTQG